MIIPKIVGGRSTGAARRGGQIEAETFRSGTSARGIAGDMWHWHLRAIEVILQRRTRVYDCEWDSELNF